MRYRTSPKFHFRDPAGGEWRIRRPITLRSPWRPKWRVEQKNGERWLMRASADTRGAAHDRMLSLWGRS